MERSIPVSHSEGKKTCRYLSRVECVDFLLKVLEQNNATKVPGLLYLGWMYSLWPIMKGPAYRCASTQQHRRPPHTHTHTQVHAHTYTYTGQASARLSSPKIIRHQNEFPCFFFFLLLFILFMYWNSGDWLLQLTCSHHEFSLHHYMGTLQEQGSCDYRDAINMHTLTETHARTGAEVSDTHKPMHLFTLTSACWLRFCISLLCNVFVVCGFLMHNSLTILARLQCAVRIVVGSYAY